MPALLLAVALLAAAPAPPSLPAAVPVKTRSQSFNRRYLAALRDGRIWFKANEERTGIREGWRPLDLPPDVAGRVVELAVDDTYVLAVTEDRAIHTMTGFLEEPSRFRWTSRWGAPFWRGKGMKLPAVASARGWDISFNSVEEDKYWVDAAGNRQSLGAGCTSLYALGADGREITLVDPWLPTDLSYQVCGPRRGAFVAEAISASGSTIAVMNRYGDLWVRTYDFDIAGGDWVFFAATYEDMSRPDARPGLQGADLWKLPRKLTRRYSEGLSDRPRQLPPLDWARQEKVPGAITDAITVTKEGEGGARRWLRVEGMKDGRTGYFRTLARFRERDAAGAPVPQAWEFVETKEPLQGRFLDNLPEDATDRTLGPVEAHDYPEGALQKGKPGWRAAVAGFHPYCSPAPLRIAFTNGESLDLSLHTRETIRQSPRAPGLDANPLVLQGAVELPQPLLDAGPASLGPAAREFLAKHFGKGRFRSVRVEATTSRLVIKGFAGRKLVLSAAP